MVTPEGQELISLYAPWAWTSARAPIYVLYDDRAPKTIQDVVAVPGHKVQQQVVPGDDAAPEDGEVTVLPAQLL